MSKHVFPIFIWFIDHQFLLSMKNKMIYLRFIGIHARVIWEVNISNIILIWWDEREMTHSKKKTFHIRFTVVFMMMVRKREWDINGFALHSIYFMNGKQMEDLKREKKCKENEKHLLKWMERKMIYMKNLHKKLWKFE